jgi:uncharacterized membrane protein YccC
VLVIFLVLSIGVPAPVSAMDSRAAGIALAAALAAAAAVLLWPLRPRLEVAHGARALLDDLTALVPRLARGDDDVPPLLDRFENRLDALVARAAAIGLRPAGSTTRDRARAYLLDDITRIIALARSVDEQRDPAGAPAAGPGVEAHLRDAADTLAAASRALAGRSEEPSPDRATAPVADERALAGMIGAGLPPEVVARAAGRLLAAAELAWVARSAAVHAAGHSIRVARGDRRGQGQDRAGLHAGRVLRVLRADLSPSSPRLHDAARMGLALALAVGMAAALGLEHGFWVSFATFTVLRTAARATAITSAEAVLGTVLGFVGATILVLSGGDNDVALALTLPALVFLAVWGNEALGLVTGQAFFTIMVVVLFNLVEPGGWAVGLVRLVDVVVGAVAGLVVGLVAWPGGSGRALRRALAALLEASAAYDRLALRGILAGTERRLVGTPERTVAEAAAQRLDEVVEHCIGEGRPGGARLAAWVAAASSAQRLWYSVDHASFRPVPPSAAAGPAHDRALARVEATTDAIDGLGRETAAGSAIGQAPVSASPTAAVLSDGVQEGIGPEALVRTLSVLRWCDGAEEGLARLRSRLRAALAPG